MAPHRHRIVVDNVAVTSARTNTNVPRIGARLPLTGSLALGAQHGKFDADHRTSALLDTPSVQLVHDYYPFELEDGGRSAPMAAELVDRLATFVADRRFPSMGVVNSRSLRSDSHIRMMQLLLLLFGDFGGMCGENSCNGFLLLFMVLRVPIPATLCKRAVLMLWHAFMFLVLRFF
jgi:hypothetical protein